MTQELLVVHVHVHVHADHVDAFRAASLEKATHGLREPGIARFDVVQDLEDPTRFVLVEAFRHLGAPAEHKATAHYAKWRDAVEPMMAEPRRSTKFRAWFPAADAW
jgi:quinol monooxygenase YgiN